MNNKLTETRMFYENDKIKGVKKKMASIHYQDYFVPKTLYSNKLDNIKGFKLPLVKEIIDSINDGHVVPTMLNESIDPKSVKDIFAKKMMPRGIFNLPILNGGQISCISDFSIKGKYSYDNHGNLIYWDVSDIAFYYFSLAAYSNFLFTTSINTYKAQLLTLIAESYAIILGKCIDRDYPMTAHNVEFDKLIFLCGVFCLESMFGVEKQKAVELALKFKSIHSKQDVMNESVYFNSTKTMLDNVDGENRFPIDNFCDILKEEYEYIASAKFDPIILAMQFTNMYNNNAVFALEHSMSFITMLILGKGRLKIYDDFKINKFLEITRKDFIKEFCMLISDK